MNESKRAVYHVLPADDGWVVEAEKGDVVSRHRTKDEAERAARERAGGHDLAQVKVHDAQGRFEHESTYGNDPRHRPG